MEQVEQGRVEKRTVARTEAYLAMMEQRRSGLAAEFARIFPRPLPFAGELGCGTGHFLTAYAQAHPEKLGIVEDIVGERIARAVRKRDRARLSNLHFVHAEARLFLEYFPKASRSRSYSSSFP